MTRTALRLPLAALAAGDRVLDPAAAKYLVRVHRRKLHDPVVAFDPRAGLECSGRITHIDHGTVTVTLDTPRASRQLPRQPLILLQGLAKPARVGVVVRAATELGVTQLWLTTSDRSQARQLTDAQLARLGRIALDAARQCGRGDVPTIHCFASVAQALTHTAREHPNISRWLLHPSASAPAAQPHTPAHDVLVAVGPEGGFCAQELALFADASFTPLRLGAFVLRTETAAIAALGAALALRSEAL